MVVIFPSHLPLSRSMTAAQVNLVSSLSHPEERALLTGDGVWLTPACQWERETRAWSAHAVCVSVCSSKENQCLHVCVCVSMLNKASHSWQRLSREGTERERVEEDRRRRRNALSFLFLSAGENVSMHQSVWLLAQNPATHPHTNTHTPGR